MVQRLKSSPAFGFETASSNAHAFYKAKFPVMFTKQEIREHIVDRMVEESPEMRNLEHGDIFAASVQKRMNRAKVVGMIPVVGSIMGLARIIFSCMISRRHLPNRSYHLIRGTIELLSLGFLLLIPDLIVTFSRNRKATAGVALG